MTTFDNTRAALAVYEAGRAARNEAWDKVKSVTDIHKCEAADTAALVLVQEAFYQDTSAYNSRESCGRLDYYAIRQTVPHPKSPAPTK
jgi:hypothetical protein